MERQFFAALLADTPPLFQAMLAANGLSGEGSCACVTLPEGADNAAARAFLASRALRRRLPREDKTTPPPFWDFAEESRRLALMDVPTLTRLSRTLGAAIHARAISAAILREDVVALKCALGEAVYCYALQRGSYQMGNGLRRFFLSRDEHLPLAERVGHHGQLALAMCCANWPNALREQARGRLGDVLPFLTSPAHGAASAGGWSPENQPDPALFWFTVKRILLKEVAPQWAPYFN